MDEATITPQPATEAVMRRLLCLPACPTKLDTDDTSRMFGASMALTGLRCIFTYMFLPILTPALGAVVGPVIGVPLSAVAIVFDIRGIRSFWRADHPQRWLMTVLYLVVMGFVTYLLVRDLTHLTV
ncbi:MAG: hypothetical protein ACYDEA_08100 [Candidatus Dormibacteria bacterium]